MHASVPLSAAWKTPSPRKKNPSPGACAPGVAKWRPAQCSWCAEWAASLGGRMSVKGARILLTWWGHSILCVHVCVCACVCASLVDGVDPGCSCAKQRTGARSCASHKHTRCAGICPLPVLIPRCATQTLRVPRGGRLDTSLVARTNAAGPVRRMRRGGGVGIGGQPPPGYFWRAACVAVHVGFHRVCSTVARERC